MVEEDDGIPENPRFVILIGVTNRVALATALLGRYGVSRIQYKSLLKDHTEDPSRTFLNAARNIDCSWPRPIMAQDFYLTVGYALYSAQLIENLWVSSGVLHANDTQCRPRDQRDNTVNEHCERHQTHSCGGQTDGPISIQQPSWLRSSSTQPEMETGCFHNPGLLKRMVTHFHTDQRSI